MARPPTLISIPETAPEAVAMTLKKNPQFLPLNDSARASREDELATRRKYFPKIDLTARAFERSNLGSSGFTGDTGGCSAGVRITLLLFTGGRCSAEKDLARLNLESAELDVNQWMIDMRADTSLLYRGFDRRGQRIVLLDQTVKKTQLSVDTLVDHLSHHAPEEATFQDLLDQLDRLLNNEV